MQERSAVHPAARAARAGALVILPRPVGAGAVARGLRRLSPLAPFALALTVFLLFRVTNPPVTHWDEPQYVLVATSIGKYGTYDLRTVYQHDVQRLFHVDTMDEGAGYQKNGTRRAWHYPGLPLLLSPVMALGGGVGAVRVVMLLISALLATELFGLLKETRFAPDWLVSAVWATVVFSFPLLVHADTIYPEMLAGLIVVYGVRRLRRPRPSTWTLAVVALGAAFLPWLNYRYLPLAAGLVLGTAYLSLADKPARPGEWQRLFSRRNYRALAGPALLLLSLILMAACFQYWYGTLSPFAAQLPPGRYSVEGMYVHALGQLLSPTVGWLPYAPVYLLGLAGLGVLARRWGWPVLVAALLVVLYVATLGTQWGQGPTPPGRYVVTIVPLVAVPLLLVLSVSRVLRLWFIPLAAVSFAIAFAGMTHPTKVLATDFYLTPKIPVAADLSGMWPAIIERRSGFVVDTSNGSHLTGVAEARPNGPDFLARAGVDAPGWLLYGGPLPAIRRGYYTAIFSLAANTTAPGQLGMLEVYTDNLGVVARKVLQRDDFPADGSFRDFSLPFTAQTDMEGLRLAVGVTGTADIRAMGAVLQRDARGNLPLTAEDRFPGWPLTVAWLAGIALLATVLAFPGAAPPQGPRQRVPPA